MAKTQFVDVLRTVNDWLSTSNHTHPPTSRQSVEYTHKWDYVDKENNLIACVYRYDTDNGKRYRPWDALQKRYKAPNPRPLYNQPDMLKATQVVLVEGEKAASALIGQGIVATTAMFGANAQLDKTDWSPLNGKHVIIWPDNDKAGHQYAQAVSQYLAKTGLLLSLRVLSIPDDKPNRWDAADAVAEGVNINQFIDSSHHVQPTRKPPITFLRAGQLLYDITNAQIITKNKAAGLQSHH